MRGVTLHRCPVLGAPIAEWIAEARATMLATEARLARERENAAKRTPPRATGPASGFRAQHALPPPHHRLTRADVRRANRLERTEKRRSAARLPPWALRLAFRCVGSLGGLEREFAQVPTEVARRIKIAQARYATSEAQRACAALGLSVWWMSTRHPRRCGRPANLPGLGQGLLCRLAPRADGTPYSRSQVFHGWHGRGPTIGGGPRGGRIGEGEQTGFLRALTEAGVLLAWVPPATNVASWLVGPSGYAYACLRAVVPESDPPPS